MRTSTVFAIILTFLLSSSSVLTLAQERNLLKTRKAVWDEKEVEFVHNSIAIKLRRGADHQSLENLFNRFNARISQPFDELGWGWVELPEGEDIIPIAKMLGKYPNIEIAKPNFFNRINVDPNDPYFAGVSPASYPHQWNLRNLSQIPLGGTIDADIDAPEAWDVTTGSQNVVIAILDSGIPMMNGALSHPDLSSTSRIILGPDYTNDGEGVRDLYGHGTHVAGIAAAESNNGEGISGVAWNCRIMVIQVFVPGPPAGGSDQWFFNGVKYAADYAQNNPGTRVIVNYSGGGGPSSEKESAIQYANARNVVVVASAGNNAGPVLYPAAYSTSYSNVIAVSATNHQDALSGYSNYGSQINVAAPGGNGFEWDSDDIFSTTPTYSFSLEAHGAGQYYGHISGTSMAAPHVTGTAALMLSVNPSFSPSALRTTLQQNADDKGPSGFDNQYGHGRINVLKSVARSYVMANPQYSYTTGSTPIALSQSNVSVLFSASPCPGQSPGLYLCDRYVSSVTLTGYYPAPKGWYLDRPGFSMDTGNNAVPWYGVTTTSTSITIRTYFYWLKYNSVPEQVNQWAPFDPYSSAREYGVLGIIPPPPSVSITGPTIAPCATGTWTANVTGGIPPFTYQWYHQWDCYGTQAKTTEGRPEPDLPCNPTWNPVGTNSATLQYYLCCGNAILRVDIRDALNRPATDQHYVTGDCGGGQFSMVNGQLPAMAVPSDFSTAQNYPNPFNPETQIKFDLPEIAYVRITISNILGQIIMTLADDIYPAGFHHKTWNGTSERGQRVESGTYFCRVYAKGETGKEFSKVIKMILTK